MIDDRGRLEELHGPHHEGLGLGGERRRFEMQRRRLGPGDRLLLVSDGVLDRRTHAGERFGLEGVRSAVRAASGASPAETVRALEDAVMARSRDRLEDDATIVVLEPTSPR